MTNYEKEQQIIRWLREYKAYKCSIENLNQLVIDIAEEGMGIDYSRDKIGQTNKFSSDVENKVIKLEKYDVERRIKSMSNVVNAIDKAMESLTDIEKQVITNRCINGLYFYQFCYQINVSERTTKRIKKEALKKMSIVIFGIEWNKNIMNIDNWILISGKIILWGDNMNNFERLKSLESEYEMTDIIIYFISRHKRDIFQSDGTINSLPLLRWLQEESTNHD